MNTCILRYNTKKTVDRIHGHMSVECPVITSADKEYDVMIRYGYSGDGEAKVEYNSATAIANYAANKIATRGLMLDAGVKVPECVLPRWPEYPDLGGDWIARPRYHQAGSEFVVISNEPAKALACLKKDWYLSRIFRKTNELRVHCGHGRVIGIHDKHTGAALDSNTVSTEWTVLSWDEYNLEACKHALRAVKALELDWGAVDVLVNENDFCILEVNTAPCVPGITIPTKYAMYFDWLLSSSKRRKHYTFEKKRSVEEIVWKLS